MLFLATALSSLLAAPIFLAAAAPSPVLPHFNEFHSRNGNSSSPIIDLGEGGRYVGILQNNGTVQSWKGIPYATPPLGALRFKAPTPLADQSGVTLDVSDDALRCIQFATPGPNIIGVKAGPGVEDCLKLWIWKPASAKPGDNLPVSFYIHGGGLQYSSAANNDFSDWVGHDQNFIAVNVAYRLGALGYFASEELTAEGQNANAGSLDHRMAIDWVKKYIGHFGGNGNDITIQGQSGGGYAIVSQLALYDGKKPNFQKAIARSIQRSPMFPISFLKERNAKFAALAGCNSTTGQLACLRSVTPAALVNASNTLGSLKDSNGLSYAGFLPTNDGVTLTDTITKLWQAGKIAKVPYIGGYVTDEGAAALSHSVTALNATTIGAYNLTAANVARAASFYPVNSSYANPSGTNGFFLNTFEALEQAAASFGEAGIMGSETLTNRAMVKIGNKNVWGSRFDAPTVGTVYYDPTVPLAPVAHSADNSYLQNATSVMTSFERPVALEWRAYIGSFIRTGNPNTQKLSTSLYWPTYDALGDAINMPIRLVTAFAFNSSAKLDAPTGTEIEIPERAQLERLSWWQSAEIVNETAL